MGKNTNDSPVTDGSEPTVGSAKEIIENAEEINDYSEESEQFSRNVEKSNWEYRETQRNLRKNDITWRLKTRPCITWILVGLLLLQNIFIFGILYWAYCKNNLEELQTIFAIIVPATLIETAFMVREIIALVFKEIDYKD